MKKIQSELSLSKLVVLVFLLLKGNSMYGQWSGTFSNVQLSNPIYLNGPIGSGNPNAADGVYLGKGSNGTTLGIHFSTAVGVGALSAATGNGGWNTAFGCGALRRNNFGTNNIAIGIDAMGGQAGSPGISNAGAQNIAIGNNAMIVNTSGNYNVAVGFNSMTTNSTGSRNTAVGLTCLRVNSGGNDNAALGWTALQLTTGTGNTAVGSGAGGVLQAGNNNVALGFNALTNFTTGNGNVAIGNGATVSNGDDQLSIQNVIYGTFMSSAANGRVGIGTVPGAFPGLPAPAKLEVGGTLKIDVVNNGNSNTFLYRDANGIINEATLPFSGCSTINSVPKSNGTSLTCSQITDNGATVGIGNPTNSSYSAVSGQWYQPTTGSTIEPYVGTPASGDFRLSVQGVTRSIAYFAYSDKRLKKNIKPIEKSLAVIKKLNGVTYQWDRNNEKAKDFNDLPQVGFIAQEVVDVVSEAVVIDGDGYYSMNYSTIIPILNEGIKEQQSQIESQQVEIENLKTQLTELRNKLNQLSPGEVKLNVSSLEVVPNPITGTSTVSYKLGNSNAISFLIISDLQGKLVKQITLAKNQQQGQVQVSKSDLPNGMYVFTIVSGASEIQSKKVFVSE